MTEKKTRGGLLDYLTPMGAIRRSFKSVSQTKTILQETKDKMVASLPGQNRSDKFPENDIRNITDSRLRFQAMYDEHGWTQPELDAQAKTCQRTKLVAFVMSIISVFGVVVLVLNSPLWVTIVLTPVACVMLLLGIAKGFQFALYEAQIRLRDLISAREFVSRIDFFDRLIG